LGIHSNFFPVSEAKERLEDLASTLTSSKTRSAAGSNGSNREEPRPGDRQVRGPISPRSCGESGRLAPAWIAAAAIDIPRFGVLASNHA